MKFYWPMVNNLYMYVNCTVFHVSIFIFELLNLVFNIFAHFVWNLMLRLIGIMHLSLLKPYLPQYSGDYPGVLCGI